MGSCVLDAILKIIESVPSTQRAFLSGPVFRRKESNQSPNTQDIPVRLDGSTFVWLIV